MLGEFEVLPSWYLKRHPAALADIAARKFAGPQDHFDRKGRFEGLDPNPAISFSLYKLESGYERRAHEADLVLDYIRNAGRLKASICWLVDEGRLQQVRGDVASAIKKSNVISAFVAASRERDRSKTRPHPFFSPDDYRERAGLAEGANALTHFLREGQMKGIPPSVLFDPAYYLAIHPELAGSLEAGGFDSAAHHFMCQGMAEGRSPIPDFDPDYYLRTNPPVVDALGRGEFNSPFMHFMHFGIAERRNPNPYFDAVYYVENNPEVGRALETGRYLGPFEHFLAQGVSRGLRAHSPLHKVRVPELEAKAAFEQRTRITSHLLAATRGARFEPVEAPEVSLIIPVKDHFAFTLNLLGQLSGQLKAPGAPSAEVIVVDNGSTDRTLELEELAPGVRVLRHPEPLGYPTACNLGAQIARGRVLIMLNNDLELAPGAVEFAVQALDAEGVGAVGGRIVQLNGRMQEAGGVVWRDGSTLGYGRGDDPLDGRFLLPREVDYVSGCFMATPRALFAQLGGFDEVFAPGYYEETDYCARLWGEQRKVMFDPRIVIFHYEFASFSKGRPPQVSAARVATNRVVFARRNKAFLASRPGYTTGGEDAAAFVRSRADARRVLLIEDREPLRGLGSGFVRTADVVQALGELGCAVTVWSRTPTEADVPQWAGPGGELVETFSVRDHAGGVEALLENHGGLYDVVWAARTHSYATLSEPIKAWRERFPDTLAVADTEAVAATRTAHARALEGGALTRSEIKALAEAELKDADFADVVVVVNRLDRELLSGIEDVVLAELGHAFSPDPTPSRFKERFGFVFVGAVHAVGSPNYDSLEWFAEFVWPKVLQALPDATLAVVGHWAAGVKPPVALSHTSIVLHRDAPDLTPHLDRARVFVAPTRFAAGIPHKVEMALSRGVPTVCSELLADQLDLAGPPETNAVARAGILNPVGFADLCVRVHEDEGLWSGLRARGLGYIADHRSWPEFVERVRAILETPPREREIEQRHGEVLQGSFESVTEEKGILYEEGWITGTVTLRLVAERAAAGLRVNLWNPDQSVRHMGNKVDVTVDGRSQTQVAALGETLTFEDRSPIAPGAVVMLEINSSAVLTGDGLDPRERALILSQLTLL